ncbi:M16 family metallopeptidase [Sediminicola luteus]|uniref:Peptidase M16 n=1 Tax=Sediminicola luteus TaxID=319238 RepID=A0A2A4GCQ4_9FLAO|nr:pitrilysin family protein [Sediminicola luteus]PCE66201.1 peptidase M16 [Sediminicola luteus]
MKTKIALVTLALIFGGLGMAQEKEMPPKGGEPKGFTLSEKEVVTFDNGLRMVLVPYGSIPKATINIMVKTGNIHESEDQVWLTDILGDLMEEGPNADYDVKERLAGMGGNLNVGVGMHTTSVSTSVLSEFTPEALSLLAAVMTDPKWPADQLERLKNNMERDVTVRLSRPGSQARRDFMAEMYPGHSYGRIYPSVEQIKSYDLASIKAYYDAQFGALRTTVYVVGKFNADKVKQAVESALGQWRKGPEPSYPVAQAKTEHLAKIVDRPGAPQSTIYFGLPVAGPSDPDYVALDVMNSILGGSFGSRITSNIREDKGYTYSPYSDLDANYKSGLWYEVADVTTEHTGASLDEIKKEIKRLKTEAPSEEELQGIKNYESGLYVLRNSTPGGIIYQMSFLDIHDLDESFLVERVNNINAVTPEQVRQMAEKYIKPENMSLIVVGDKEKLRDQIEETMPSPVKKE